MNYAAVIVAAGKSTRFGDLKNKLLYKLSDDLTVLEHSIRLFRADEDCKQLVIVCNEETIFEAMSNKCDREYYCMGGDTRCQSVFEGLHLVNQSKVLVHDGARCYLEKEDLEQLKTALETSDGAILVGNIYDTVKQVDENGYIIKTINRDSLKRALTPQGFDFDKLFKAYKQAIKADFMATDEASVMENFSDVKIKCVLAKGENRKVTTLDDIK